ncbi:hypothetical protein MBM09_00740 [Flaviramulus sp. BrNp1-15]|uniref:hypothetical protein n=1 Tax=Flaviramulus sp. BrNp1-15 TaxID=2916754 RepID=UPI001EE86649|nr:hypothetical protein [Flaviramulus sp. BrNp1-15]ULC59520.1 hypothetical protein MBM09_00740 [Flaviramulus sp. BrNp1-15]
MSYLKDIEESSEFLKSFVISLLISPLWYLSIFFLNNNFYENTNGTVLIVLSGTLSFVSVFFMTFILLLTEDFKEEKENEEDRILKSVSVSALILIIWKSILLFVVYSVGFFCNAYIYFYWYIIIFFLINIVVLIIEFIPEKNK